METNDIIKTRLEAVLPILNERQRRIYLSAEAQNIGWGDKGTHDIAGGIFLFDYSSFTICNFSPKEIFKN